MSDNKAFTQDAAIRESLDQQHDDAIRAKLRAEIAQEIKGLVPHEYSGDFDEGVVTGLRKALRIVEGDQS